MHDDDFRCNRNLLCLTTQKIAQIKDTKMSCSQMAPVSIFYACTFQAQLPSQQELSRIRKICEEHLKGRYEIEVIDIRKQPERAIKDNIVAVPALIRELPSPVRNLIGDMSEKERVLVGLELEQKDTNA